MHYLCMATKTISLTIKAYQRLRRAKRHAGESFSDVVMRAVWDEEPITAGARPGQLRHRVRTPIHGWPNYSAVELDVEPDG